MVLSICVHFDVVILYGAVKLSVTYNLTLEKIIGNRGVFLFYQKIAAIMGMLMSSLPVLQCPFSKMGWMM